MHIPSTPASTNRSVFVVSVLAAAFLVFLFGAMSVQAAILRQLDLGSKGPDVVELQTYFAVSTRTYPSNRVTGTFDSLTQTAVQRFQVTQGIVSSGTPKTTGYGRVGPRTALKLNALLALPVPTTTTTPTLPPKNVPVLVPSEPMRSALPLRLSIPKINVNAPITYVGLTPQGAMGAPKGPSDAVWFNLGPRPGEKGSAVIAGHYGPWKNGQGSVFDGLNTLKEGDTLSVDTGNGATIAFVVRKIRMYGRNEDASTVFGSSDGGAHLNLITCEGVWDTTERTYSNRLVVFTDRVTE
jgi:LPXTG-site transpeptidase (sortase) family protein